MKQTNNSKELTSKIRLHTRVKQSFYSKHPFFVPLMTIGLLFVVSVVGFLAFGGHTLSPSDARIIKIHSDGKTQTIPSRASTVEEFLKRANIKYEEGDVVEPALNTQITSDQFTINLYKAKLVTIIDDAGKKTITKTAKVTPDAIATDVGYKIYPEDKIEVTPPTEAIADGVIGTQIKIEQSVPVKLNLYGVTYDIRTRAGTIADLAKERGIEFSDQSVLPAPSTKIAANQAVFITDPGKQLVSGEEDIPSSIETVDDPDLDLGRTQVKSEGSNGKKAIVYEVLPDGSRKLLQEVVINQPVNKVVARGKKAPTVAPNVSVSADKASIMAAAGISPDDYAYVDYIVGRESGWRPGAGNASSGAYGLCQALPASKMATAGGDYITNPVTQLKWCSGYANSRYGSWASAYSFWLARHWW